ncbi:oligopeptide transporter 2 [Diutina catenulata]
MSELEAIRSTDLHDPRAHELDLAAITSQPLSLNHVGDGLTDNQKQFVLARLNYSGLDSYENLPLDAVFMIEKIAGLSTTQALQILEQAIEDHRDDFNVNAKDFDLWVNLVGYRATRETLGDAIVSEKEKVSESVHIQSSGSEEDLDFEHLDVYKIYDWDLQVRLEAALNAYWSPYTEIRAVTEPFDDPEVSAETARVYVLGIIWVAIGAVVNQFFTTRQPSITLNTSVVQVFIYPCGLLAAKVLPAWNIGFGKYKFSLNPGPWTNKEQLLATMFFAVAGASPYVSSNIIVQKLPIFYDNSWADFGYQVLLILSTQFMGFGFAGLLRKFVVYPIHCIFPSNLPTLALNKALLKPSSQTVINGWKISGYMFFFITFGVAFLYFWIPNYLMGFLSYFNWMTWIAPNNFNLAAVTGSVSGLGLNPIPSFDWSIINYNNCLNLSVFTQIYFYIGLLISFVCIIGVYYSNYKWTAFMPINSNHLFTNTGESYDVLSVVNEESLFDAEKYAKYGPPFYTAANLVVYGTFFALYLFAIIFEFGTRWKQMAFSFKQFYRQFKNLRTSSVYDGFDDPFTAKMRKYKEVPDWVFFIVLIISIVLAILCVKLYPAATPVWTIFFALGINLVFLVPLTTISAITGLSFGLNVLVELIIGYAIPGNGLALNFVKALGYNIDGQAMNYIGDQKMTHLASISPRSLFRCQMIAVFVSAFVSLGIISFQLTGIKDFCTPHQPQKFSCPGENTFYSASITWGVIGPQKSFQLYPILKWCFLIGAVAGFICIGVKRILPRDYARKFQPTLILVGMLSYAPYNLSYYTGGLYVSIAFMWYIRERFTSWWVKYNYLLSAGLTSGVALSGIIIFFAVQYHDKSLNWWGNSVSYAGADGAGLSLRNATLEAPEGYFGPRIGDFPA